MPYKVAPPMHPPEFFHGLVRPEALPTPISGMSGPQSCDSWAKRVWIFQTGCTRQAALFPRSRMSGRHATGLYGGNDHDPCFARDIGNIGDFIRGQIRGNFQKIGIGVFRPAFVSRTPFKAPPGRHALYPAVFLFGLDTFTVAKSK